MALSMSNQIILPVSQMATWLDRWCSNSMSDQVRREIDAEILDTLCRGLSPACVPETPDWQLWLTEDQLAWCKKTQIEFTACLSQNPQTITFIFESESQATQFAITWL